MHINYLAILVSAIVLMILGMLWYGPLFGKLWTEGMGWTPEQMDAARKQAGAAAMIQMFILALVELWALAYVLRSFVISMPGKSHLAIGLFSGFLVWLGFLLPAKYGDTLWNGKKFKYVAVDLGYHLVAMLIVGLILGAWYK